jgi:putative transposase
MPRANRYILPGHTYHVTHRCHGRKFLLRFAVHRTEYRRRLRAALKGYDVSLLAYSITSNHTHLLINSGTTEALSAMMQKLEGEFAEYYNLHKKRTGAFWNGRYHATMIDSGQYLWNCMKYIDVNMVRAGAVAHPDQWTWCGYDELEGKRKRYRLLDLTRAMELLGACAAEDLAGNYRTAVIQTLESGRLAREPVWTESIAVGSESFVSDVAAEIWNREELDQFEGPEGSWVLRETGEAYTTEHSRQPAQTQLTYE